MGRKYREKEKNWKAVFLNTGTIKQKGRELRKEPIMLHTKEEDWLGKPVTLSAHLKVGAT